MIPTIGRIVHYTLTDRDAADINQTMHRDQQLVGNRAVAGTVYPLMIVQVWGKELNSAFNGQLIYDGNFSYWICSTEIGDGAGKCAWPLSGPSVR